MSTWNISPAAKALHTNSLVWDNHACLPLRPDDSFIPQLQRFRDSGVNLVSINVAFDGVLTWYEGIKILSFYRDWILRRPDEYVLVGTTSEAEACRTSGKLGVFFDVEGMDALDGQVSLLRTFYDLGVRWMLIAYNKNNLAGGGCMDDDQGLTSFGREVIDAAEEIGMQICCSHTGERTCLDVFEYSKNPVIMSHSNPRMLRDHRRNITDDMMRACAATGGVVGINGYGSFLQHGDTSPENIFRHIDYTVNVVGAQHVGLGMDYVFDKKELIEFMQNAEVFPDHVNTGDTSPVNMVEPEKMPAITEQFLLHGYSDDDIRAILGGNLLRVARKVWR